MSKEEMEHISQLLLICKAAACVSGSVQSHVSPGAQKLHSGEGRALIAAVPLLLRALLLPYTSRGDWARLLFHSLSSRDFFTLLLNFCCSGQTQSPQLRPKVG